MEWMMQQSLQSEGSGSYRSSSPLSENDECNEFNAQKCSEADNNYNGQLDNLWSCPDSRNLTNNELDTMVQSYKQLGGELELNLKILENDRLSLNKVLTETKHECEILNKQKECQKKNLVDLQIRLENLDAEKMNIWHENQKDKLEKFETIKQEMQIILDNDAYSKKEIELHEKEGVSYIDEVKKINDSFKLTYEELLKKESKIIEDLKAAIVSFKSTDDSRKTFREKLCFIKKELVDLEKDNGIFRASITERNDYLNNLKIEYRNTADSHKNTLNNLNEKILDFQSRCQQNLQDKVEKNKVLLKEKENLQLLTDENFELKGNLTSFEIKNKSDSQDLNLLVEHCLSLKSELHNLIAEQQNLEAEIVLLPVLVEKLSQLELTEKDLSSSVQCLSEEEKQLKLEEEGKEKEYKNINLSLALSELEISKSALEEAVGNESSRNEISQEERIRFENCIKEKEKELDEIKQHISQNGIICDEHQKQIEVIKTEIVLLKNETESQELKLAKIVEEDKELIKKEDELKYDFEKLKSIEEDLVATNGELGNVKMEVDENENVSDLESTLNSTILQTEELKKYHASEIESIKTSFQKQEKIYSDKTNREIGEINRKSLKEEAHEKRVSLAVPRLNNEMAKLESDLKNLLPELSREIKSGLDIINDLCTFYGQMFDSKQDKGKATIIRNLTSIEEQLASPMKCMMTLDYIPKINLNPPTRNGYLQILKSFREKFVEIIEQLETAQPVEMANKLQEMGSCLFGKKYVKPPFNPQVLNDTEISSSTEVYF
ncbi:putative autophagy-related protein 11 [Halyomorpha halys]|uniref:putative autophagy-related protein 11 n=1 Tax=Halyomorpha halys TaxID=286706 RepID=UPI0006D4D494